MREWLQAGVIEKGRFTPTEEGTPQGGVISPLLLNVALHGMEQAAGVRYRNSARSDAETVSGSPSGSTSIPFSSCPLSTPLPASTATEPDSLRM